MGAMSSKKEHIDENKATSSPPTKSDDFDDIPKPEFDCDPAITCHNCFGRDDAVIQIGLLASNVRNLPKWCSQLRVQQAFHRGYPTYTVSWFQDGVKAPGIIISEYYLGPTRATRAMGKIIDCLGEIYMDWKRDTQL
jgi:hypothetical protein